MTDSPPSAPERSYGCTFGCGNPYDYIVIDVASGETQFLCLPDFVRLAHDMITAVISPDAPEVQQWVALGAMPDGESVPGPKGRRRGHNAPATNDDPDLFTAFDEIMTVDDLPEEFK